MRILMIKFLDVIDVFYLKVQFSWILLYWSIVSAKAHCVVINPVY